MKPVTVEKAGEKFIFKRQELTVESFFGSSGEQYLTASEAKKNNPNDTFICVKNKEHGGATELNLSIKISPPPTGKTRQ